MFDPEGKRGKTIEKRREEHKARRGVKGAKVPAYKVEEVEVVEDYETKKKEEIMGALKKRDLKQKVKEKIAADIIKRKGDVSKSDDRYAYESKLWDQVAANLTELGELNDADFKVEGYQRNPEKDPQNKPYREKTKAERMADPERGINSPAFKKFMASQGM